MTEPLSESDFVANVTPTDFARFVAIAVKRNPASQYWALLSAAAKEAGCRFGLEWEEAKALIDRLAPDFEPCPTCSVPMVVTGRNVRAGPVEIGTTWACKNPKCDAYNPAAKGSM